MRRWVWGLARSREGQMTVELAVLTPVVMVVALVVLNLMGFVEACAAFDQAARDAIVAQGVAPPGEQSEIGAVEGVQATLEELLGRSDRCEVEVRAESTSGTGQGSFAISPLLTRYVCTLTYRPWPRSVRFPGITYEAPLALRHECSLVVDRYRPGVVV
ncbi:hypothetical protein [Thermophilibacter sp.]|uniref:hypothetical protein n=1 Tax=Thermophilibacter sp. TaxID=2847309 RepID=UPI003A8CE628